MARTKQFDQAVVLEKAKTLFWKQGFHATSVQDLVNHLGINRASLYDTFGGKNALYEACLKSYRKENQTFLKSELLGSTSPRRALKGFFVKVLNAALKDPESKGCFMVNCTTEYLPLNFNVLDDLKSNQKDVEKIFAQCIKEGKTLSEFSKSTDEKSVASFLFTFLSGLQVRTRIGGKSTDLRKMIDLAFDGL